MAHPLLSPVQCTGNLISNDGTCMSVSTGSLPPDKIFTANTREGTVAVNMQFLRFNASNSQCRFTEAYESDENCVWNKTNGGVHEIKTYKSGDDLVLKLATKVDLKVILGTFGFIGDKNEVACKVTKFMYPKA